MRAALEKIGAILGNVLARNQHGSNSFRAPYGLREAGFVAAS